MHMSRSDNSWNASICNCSLVACRGDRNVSRALWQITRAAFSRLSVWVELVFLLLCRLIESGFVLCKMAVGSGFRTAAFSVWVSFIQGNNVWEVYSFKVQTTSRAHEAWSGTVTVNRRKLPSYCSKKNTPTSLLFTCGVLVIHLNAAIVAGFLKCTALAPFSGCF